VEPSQCTVDEIDLLHQRRRSMIAGTIAKEVAHIRLDSWRRQVSSPRQLLVDDVDQIRQELLGASTVEALARLSWRKCGGSARLGSYRSIAEVTREAQQLLAALREHDIQPAHVGLSSHDLVDLRDRSIVRSSVSALLRVCVSRTCHANVRVCVPWRRATSSSRRHRGGVAIVTRDTSESYGTTRRARFVC